MAVLIHNYSAMPVTFPISPGGLQVDASLAFGSRMEAATDALLRIRNEVVTTLDQQVIELRQIHRAFASAPPAMTVIEDKPSAMQAMPSPSVDKPSLFDHAPRMAPVPAGPASSLAPLPAPVPQRVVEVAVASVEQTRAPFEEATLDPMLEQATLEELNDALASAFAMVSSRARQ